MQNRRTNPVVHLHSSLLAVPSGETSSKRVHHDIHVPNIHSNLLHSPAQLLLFPHQIQIVPVPRRMAEDRLRRPYQEARRSSSSFHTRQRRQLQAGTFLSSRIRQVLSSRPPGAHVRAGTGSLCVSVGLVCC